MIYDSGNNRLIVFGGESENAQGVDVLLNDVWALSLGCNPEWTLLAPSGTPPSVREGHSAVYVPGTPGRMLVFGGNDNFWDGRAWIPRRYRDVFQLTLGATPAWSTLSTGGALCERTGHTAIWDPNLARMVVFGGTSNPYGIYLPDCWAFYLSNNSWEYLSGPPNCDDTGPPTPNPDRRAYHSHVYDPTNNRMIILGGDYEGDFNVSNAWLASDGGTWIKIGDAPWVVSNFTGVYDPNGGPGSQRMLVFGGWAGAAGTFTNALRALSLPGDNDFQWFTLAPSGTPPPPSINHQAVFAAAEKTMYLFGGEDEAGEPFNDVWALGFDTAAPAAVTDLDYQSGAPGAVTLRWSAPADEGGAGAGCSYEIRYSTSPITDDASFDAATLWGSAPAPAPAGTDQSTTISPLSPNVFWHFAMKTTDEATNRSVLSNTIRIKPRASARIYEGDGSPRPIVKEVAGLALRIDRILPNPNAGELRVHFTLPGHARARLDVLDLSGRRVRSRDLDFGAPGQHVVRLGDGDPLRPGYYLVRLTQEERSVSRPTLVVQ